MSTSSKLTPYQLVTSAWYVIYKIQWSTFRLCTLTVIQPVIFNLHINNVWIFTKIWKLQQIMTY